MIHTFKAPLCVCFIFIPVFQELSNSGNRNVDLISNLLNQLLLKSKTVCKFKLLCNKLLSLHLHLLAGSAAAEERPAAESAGSLLPGAAGPAGEEGTTVPHLMHLNKWFPVGKQV